MNHFQVTQPTFHQFCSTSTFISHMHACITWENFHFHTLLLLLLFWLLASMFCVCVCMCVFHILKIICNFSTPRKWFPQRCKRTPQKLKKEIHISQGTSSSNVYSHMKKHDFMHTSACNIKTNRHTHTHSQFATTTKVYKSHVDKDVWLTPHAKSLTDRQTDTFIHTHILTQKDRQKLQADRHTNCKNKKTKSSHIGKQQQHNQQQYENTIATIEFIILLRI